MRRLACVALAAGLWWNPVQTAEATEVGNGRQFGLGVILGSPTGISGKYYFNQENALDGAIATWGRWGGFYGHATYLWHPTVLATDPAFELPFYFGVGGFLGSYGYGDFDAPPGWRGYGGAATVVGARGAAGIEMNFNEFPLQVFLDVSGNLAIVPGIGFGLGAGLGGRYYF